jgi:tetratricopeptide (TPR) repeat protein
MDADASGTPEALARLLNQVAWHYIMPASLAAAEVIPLAEKAVQLQPFNSSYRNTLGAALYRAGRYAEAIRCLEASVMSDGTHTELDWYFLALCHQREGRTDKARQCFAQAESWKKRSGDLSAAETAEVTALRSEAALLGLR